MLHKTLYCNIFYCYFIDNEPVPVFAEPNGSKVFLDVVFPVPVDTLFSLLWLTESPFWSRFMILRKTKNWFADEWQNQPDGKIIRECRCLQVGAGLTAGCFIRFNHSIKK